MSSRKLYFDRSKPPHQSLFKSELSRAAEKPVFVYGDNNPVQVYLTDGLGGFDADSGAVGVTMKMGIVTPGAQPTGGTYKLQYNGGDKTAAIDYNDSAADIETALDALTGVSVAVTGSFPCYEIEWDSTGAQNDITAATGASDDNALTPDGSISVSKLVDGDGSNKEKLLLEIRRAPHALLSTWSTITNGWSGDFNTRTAEICELLGTSASIDSTLEVEITDASGKIYTVAQVPCVVRNHGIDTGSPALNTPDDYYTETEADNLFVKKAQNLADVADAATSRTNLGISAANTPFSANDATDWTVEPDDVKEALDELADRTNGLSATKTESAKYTVTEAGTPQNLDPEDSDAITTYWIDAQAGTGAYEKHFVLQRPTSGEPAPPVLIKVDTAASANPTIKIFDEGPTDSAGDDVLEITINGDAKRADRHVFIFVWDRHAGEWDLFWDNRGDGLGMHTIGVPATAIKPRDTNGATAVEAESTTNKLMVDGLQFGNTIAEYGQFKVPLPPEWDAGAVCARFYWKSPATGDVFWGIQGLSVGDNGLLDPVWGTAITLTDTSINADRQYVSDWTDPITIDSAAADAMTYIQVYRDPTEAGDTIADNVVLIGVEILFTVTGGRSA